MKRSTSSACPVSRRKSRAASGCRTMKAKKLKEPLQQMAEEGVVQVFRPHDGSPAMVGVVGPLQLDVLRVRLKDEYGLEVSWDQSEFDAARWIAADGRPRRREGVRDLCEEQRLERRRRSRRRPGLPRAQPIQPRLYPRARAGIVFTDIKDVKKVAAAERTTRTRCGVRARDRHARMPFFENGRQSRTRLVANPGTRP